MNPDERAILESHFYRVPCGVKYRRFGTRFFGTYSHPARKLLRTKSEDKGIDPVSLFNNRGEYYVDPKKLRKDYWNLHNIEYIERLDRLVKNFYLVPETYFGKKAVVAVPAMDEPKLLRTIRSIQDSYGEDFSDDLLLVIYHNYVNDYLSLDIDVRQAIVDIELGFKNVITIEEQVGENNTPAMAKKVLTDMVLRTMPANMELPIVNIDSDVVYLSPYLIQKSIHKLGHDHIHAVTSQWDYDREGIEYDVLNLIWDLYFEYRIDWYNKGLDIKRIYGAFYAINPHTLLTIGGVKPSVNYEDLATSCEIMSLNRSTDKPIFTFSPNDDDEQGIFHILGTRELNALNMGMVQWQRWDGNSFICRPQEIGERIPIRDIPVRDIPEFGVLNDKNIKHSLTRVSPILPFYLIPKDKRFYDFVWRKSRTYLKAMQKVGIIPKKVKILSIDGPKEEQININQERIEDLLSFDNPERFLFLELLDAELSN